MKPADHISVGLDVLHACEQYRFEPNAKTGLYVYGEGRIPDYTIFNLRSSYEVNKNWKISIGTENLFNKMYQPAIAWWTARDSDFTNSLGIKGTFMAEYRF